MSGNPARSELALLRFCALAAALALAPGACTTAKARQPVRIPASPQAVEAQRDCDQGSVRACGTLGQLLTAPEMTQLDFERGMVLMEMACGQDDAPTCAALGTLYARHAKRQPTTRARAQEMLSRSCDQRVAPACTALGRMLGQDAGNAAGEKFRRSCELGDAEGCEALALFDENKTIVDSDKTSTDEAFARACQGGRPGSCHHLALRELEDPATHERGLTLLINNCMRGYSPSCNVVAIRYAPLLSAAPSCERALPFAERSCAESESLGCALVDACQLITPTTRAAALEHLRATCEQGQPLACLYWGDAQESEPARNDAQIRRAYSRACEPRDSPGVALACARVEAYDLAHATTHIEADSAMSHLRDQCLAASAPACCILAGEYQSGKWVPVDPTRTTELRQRACKLGEPRCCDEGTQ